MGALSSLLLSVPAQADGDAQKQAAGLSQAASAVQAAMAQAGTLAARPPAAAAIDQLRNDLQLAQAQFQLREAIRSEQAQVYDLAKAPAQEPAVLSLLPASQRPGLTGATDAIRGAWRLAGIEDPTSVHPHYSHQFDAGDPLPALEGYYKAAAASSGIDWTYLAALNYIESDFGRVNGPSSAGAQGPMQFLPSTWAIYGRGGDVMDPHDAIFGAANLLAHDGAPANYDRAIYNYNHDADYVAAVEGYAAAMRADPLWLTRFYYWSTFG